MTDIQKKILSLIEKNQQEAFWEMDVPAFEEALYEFFDTFGIDEDDLSFGVSKGKKYTDTDGIEKIDAVIDIVNQSIQLNVQAIYETKWYFSFLSVEKGKSTTPVTIIPIEKEMIQQVNGKNCVFYIFDNPSGGIQLFAIPVEVAESINIRQYDNREISREEDFLYEIKDYELPFFSSYNTQ